MGCAAPPCAAANSPASAGAPRSMSTRPCQSTACSATSPMRAASSADSMGSTISSVSGFSAAAGAALTSSREGVGRSSAPSTWRASRFRSRGRAGGAFSASACAGMSWPKKARRSASGQAMRSMPSLSSCISLGSSARKALRCAGVVLGCTDIASSRAVLRNLRTSRPPSPPSGAGASAARSSTWLQVPAMKSRTKAGPLRLRRSLLRRSAYSARSRSWSSFSASRRAASPCRPRWACSAT